ncbi:MAG: malate synthase A, partial [Chloroflexota bacterium]
MPAPQSIALLVPVTGRFADILTADALSFVASLHRNFNPERERLLWLRKERQARLDAGESLCFLPETEAIRREDWFVAPVPRGLEDRRVEITGPVERKMMINAFNSGARVFMADFEDANSPTWDNLIQGQLNLIEAVGHNLTYESPDGRLYRLGDEIATLFVRPRGWHLPEKHVLVDGEHTSGSLIDFGLFAFHNARRLAEKEAGPYF